MPLRRDLDPVSSDVPVVVIRGGHEFILNSAALAKWGITTSTPELGGSMKGAANLFGIARKLPPFNESLLQISGVISTWFRRRKNETLCRPKLWKPNILISAA